MLSFLALYDTTDVIGSSFGTSKPYKLTSTSGQSGPRFASMERPEIGRLVNWAKKQKVGIGKRPAVHVLRAHIADESTA